MIGALLATLIAASPPPDAGTRTHALIVAHNGSQDPALETLRYADDDGAKYYELFSLIAPGRTTILSVLDAETQPVFPDVARAARPPSRAELDRRLERMFAEIAADNEAGHRTVFYFVYVGHGSVGESGEGNVHLLDSRFSRSDLYQQVIARSPATMNHLIIDACNSYLMIARRGEGGMSEEVIDDAVTAFLGKESLDRYPNTGVLASTSKAAEVHEWARFEAGIFSHEVRSAMAGAADIDQDGAVTYSELRAFIAAANGKVRDPKAKLEAHAQAPLLHLDEPLFDRRLAPEAPTLHVPASLADRYWLEDGRGVRYADFNLGSDGPVTLVLVPVSNTYFLRNGREELRVPLDVMRAADASELTREPITLAMRGAETLAFQRDLFAIPYGRAYFEGFLAAQRSARSPRARPSTKIPPAPLPSVAGPAAPAPGDRIFEPAAGGLELREIAALGSAGLAVAAVATGVGFGLSARADADAYRTGIGSTSDLELLRTESARSARTANILYGIGGALTAAALTLWLIPL